MFVPSRSAVNFRRRSPRPRFRLRLEGLEDRAVPALVTWDGGGGNFSWDNPLNWSTDVLPAATDDVVIDFGANDFTLTHSSGTDAIRSLICYAGLAVTGGDLEISGGSHLFGALTVTTGTLGGTGDITVAGLTTLANCTLAGSGGTFEARGGLAMSERLNLYQRNLSIFGSAVWDVNGQNSEISTSGSVTITNLGTFRVHGNHVGGGHGDSEAIHRGGSGEPFPTFDNQGTIIKESAENWLGFEGYFLNGGSIDVRGGLLRISDPTRCSTITGPIVGADGTSIEVSGLTVTGALTGSELILSHDLIAGPYQARSSTTVDGGVVSFTGPVLGTGDLTLRGTADFSPATGGPVTLTLPSLNSYRSTLQGTDDFVVSGQTSLVEASLRGPAGSSLNAAGGLQLSSSNFLNGRNLINDSTAVWTSGNVTFSNGAGFTNTGIFDDQTDGSFGGVHPDCPIFFNEGLFLKSSGDGTTDLGMQLYNSGTVQIDRGSLNIDCGYVQVVSSGGGSGGTINGTFTGEVSVSNQGEVTVVPTPTPPPPVAGYTQSVTGNLTEQIGGLTARTQYGQLVVTGVVNLAGALHVQLIPGFTPHLGDQFIVIDNQGGEPVHGTFADLPEGALVFVGYVGFAISYHGGAGNDVVLTTMIVNRPPTAKAGGPYTVAEGSSIPLNGSASSDPDQAAGTLTYEWDFDGDGQFDDAVGITPTFSAAGLDGFAGANVPVRLRVTDSAGASDISAATVNITNANPVATIHSISTVRAEGTTITAAGSATDPAGSKDTLTFVWAVFKDGSATAFATGGNTASFGFTPNDNGSYKVVLTVSDEDGGSASTEQTIAVANVAPTVALSGVSVNQGSTYTLTLSNFADPGSDTPSGVVVNWGDGSTTPLTTAQVAVVRAGSSVQVQHVYVEGGNYTVAATVSDEDGTFGPNTSPTGGGSRAVAVSAITGATQEGGRLVIVGTSGNDDIKVNPGGGAPEIKVKMNGTQQTFVGVTGIVIFANAGNDDVQIVGGIGLPVTVFGAAGNDTLSGGAGHDVLVGGDGHDQISGGAGRDLLIGGVGEDKLIGNADEDILIAGTTAYDNSADALSAIMAEWTSAAAYAIRVANLTAGVGAVGAIRLNGNDGVTQTVFSDNDVDTLTGSQAQDWFFANQNNGEWGVVDVVTDQAANEIYDDTDA